MWNSQPTQLVLKLYLRCVIDASFTHLRSTVLWDLSTVPPFSARHWTRAELTRGFWNRDTHPSFPQEQFFFCVRSILCQTWTLFVPHLPGAPRFPRGSVLCSLVTPPSSLPQRSFLSRLAFFSLSAPTIFRGKSYWLVQDRVVNRKRIARIALCPSVYSEYVNNWFP